MKKNRVFMFAAMSAAMMTMASCSSDEGGAGIPSDPGVNVQQKLKDGKTLIQIVPSLKLTSRDNSGTDAGGQGVTPGGSGNQGSNTDTFSPGLINFDPGHVATTANLTDFDYVMEVTENGKTDLSYGRYRVSDNTIYECDNTGSFRKNTGEGIYVNQGATVKIWAWASSGNMKNDDGTDRADATTTGLINDWGATKVTTGSYGGKLPDVVRAESERVTCNASTATINLEFQHMLAKVSFDISVELEENGTALANSIMAVGRDWRICTNSAVFMHGEPWMFESCASSLGSMAPDNTQYLMWKTGGSTTGFPTTGAFGMDASTKPLSLRNSTYWDNWAGGSAPTFITNHMGAKAMHSEAIFVPAGKPSDAHLELNIRANAYTEFNKIGTDTQLVGTVGGRYLDESAIQNVPIPGEWEAGKAYHYSIKVTGGALGRCRILVNSTVTDWNAQNDQNMTL